MTTMRAEPPTWQSVMAVIRAARPSFRNVYDKLAFTVHSTFFASGFVLRATGPDAVSMYHIHAIHPANGHFEAGIDKWNQLDANYAFVYATKSDVSEIVVKCFALDGKLHIDALREGFHLNPDAIARMEINVADYFPDEINGGKYAANNSNNKYNYGSMISEEDFGDLVFDIYYEVVAKFNSPPPPTPNNLRMPPPPSPRTLWNPPSIINSAMPPPHHHRRLRSHSHSATPPHPSPRRFPPHDHLRG
ncbi:OLC1v1019780C1 [Oldenlandia corymbosa var. corymbosa]|nr:OLC1v1019780C1 [Oldenlandia corymbosa var. corymbosa]